MEVSMENERRSIAAISQIIRVVSLKVPAMTPQTFSWKEATIENSVERIPAYYITRLPTGVMRLNGGHVFAHFFVAKDTVLGGEMVFSCEIAERSVRDRVIPEKLLMYYTLTLRLTDQKPTHRLLVGDKLPKFVEENNESILFSGRDGLGDTNRAKIALAPIDAFEEMLRKKFPRRQQLNREIPMQVQDPLNDLQRKIADRRHLTLDNLF